MSLRDSALRAAVLKALKDLIAAEETVARQDMAADFAVASEQLGDLKSIVVKLPDGSKVATVSLTEGRTTWQVTDEPAFLAWVTDNFPSEVETVTRVRPAFVPAMQKMYTVEGDVVVGPSGLVAEGVTVTAGAPFTSVRYTPEGRTAISDAWQAGRLDVPALPVGV